MAFCNSCGAQLASGTKFCNSCGAAVSAASPAPAPVAAVSQPIAAAPAPSGGGSSALKIILIVVGIIVFLLILVMGTCSFIAYRAVKHASNELHNNLHVKEDGDHVKVETPFGSAETSTDPAQAAKDLGVDVYPGAQAQKNGASSASFGPIHTVTGMFTSTDAVEKICSFYKEKFPSAMTSSSDTNHCTIVSTDSQKRDMVTVNIESSGDSSKIQITRVTKSN